MRPSAIVGALALLFAFPLFAHASPLFVAVSYGTATHRVMTSPDGVTWTARTAAEANDWRSVIYGNGLFVAVASGGTHEVMTSPDGVTWTARTAASASDWYSLTYGNGLFVAVADSIGTYRVMTSPDGVTWTARTRPAPDPGDRARVSDGSPQGTHCQTRPSVTGSRCHRRL